jgi:hypothetical protein
MKNIVFISLLCISFSFQLIAQVEKIPEKKLQNGFVKIDFMSIDMPEFTIANEPNMIFSGTHYNVLLNENFYTGVGIYGALTGRRGGFFTLGVNAGYKKYLSKKWYTDIGFHFGGGGGAAAPDGGGAFILPHLNFGYEFENFSINSGWSYVNFFDGGLIKNHQFNIGVEIPINYSYSKYSNSEKEYLFTALENSEWKKNSTKISLLLHANNMNASGRSKNTFGNQYNTATINLAGFELAWYFSKNWFSYVKVDGAYNGIPGGYMDVFLGAGYLQKFNKNNTQVLLKFATGAGGGGGVETSGGLLIQPDISIEQRLFDDVFIAINTGLVMTPNSDFFSNSYGIGLKYYAEKDGVITKNKEYNAAKLKGTSIVIKQEVYLEPNRVNNTNLNMQQISLQLNLNLNKTIYVAGQTSFANFGDAGAYAEGIVGLGLQSNFLKNRFKFFGQILGGAAGGGGIETGQGLIIKPSAGFDLKINEQLNFRTAAGYVKAVSGNLGNPFFNAGFSYNISFLKLK